MTALLKTLATCAAALIACTPMTLAARPTTVIIPPPRPISKEAYPDTRVPKELLSKADAARDAYFDCYFSALREAHRTGKTVAEFERIWAKLCIAEEAELTRHSAAILQYRGDRSPRATANLHSRNLRAKAVEDYRRNLKVTAELRELCGPDFKRCQD